GNESDTSAAGPIRYSAGSAVSLWLKESLHFFDAESRRSPMQYSMTVRANWPQVLDWVDLVLAANFGQGTEVVDVDEPVGDRTIDRSERHSTDDARSPIFGDAESSGVRVTLVDVDRDLIPGTLDEWL